MQFRQMFPCSVCWTDHRKITASCCIWSSGFHFFPLTWPFLSSDLSTPLNLILNFHSHLTVSDVFHLHPAHQDFSFICPWGQTQKCSSTFRVAHQEGSSKFIFGCCLENRRVLSGIYCVWWWWLFSTVAEKCVKTPLLPRGYAQQQKDPQLYTWLRWK